MRFESVGSWMVLMVMLACAGVAHAQAPKQAKETQTAQLVVSFSPDAIVDGQTTTFSWSVGTSTTVGACFITGVPGATNALSGEVRNFMPHQTTTAFVQCSIQAGSDGDFDVNGQATVTVVPQPVQPTLAAGFVHSTVIHRTIAQFEWSAQFADRCSSPQLPTLSGNSGTISIGTDTNFSGNPVDYRTIDVTCSNAVGSVSTQSTLTILPAGRPQVVYFVGTGGTRLETPHIGPLVQRVWVDFPTVPLRLLWNPFWLHFMSLQQNPHLGPDFTVAAEGAPIQIPPNAGDDDGVEGSGCLVNYVGPLCIQPYTIDLANAMRNNGIDVKIVNYDWRQAWSQHYPMIRQIVDDAYARGFGEKVYFMGHSQGTQLMRAFLRNNPDYRSKVSRIFFFGAPHLGTPTATSGNTALTGGIDFGLGWTPPFFIQKSTGLKLGGHFPSSYHQNVQRRAQEIIHYNKQRWMFSEYVSDGLVNRRQFPVEDTLDSEMQYMRSLATSQTLFDRGLQVQEELAADWHGIPSYQIVNPYKQQVIAWVKRTYPRCVGPQAGCSTPVTSVGDLLGPSDGTIPTYSSLGMFSGGPNLGSLAVTSEHQDLPRNQTALQFAARAILVDRGNTDPSFATDYTLLSDQQLLDQVGWALPPSLGGTASARKRLAVDTPANFAFEFSTPDVEAALTIKTVAINTQDTHVYRATKAGVELVSPLPAADETAEIHPGETLAPTLRATSLSLFRDGYGDDAPEPLAAVASDLASIDVDVPVLPDPYEVSITVDRTIAGTVRLSGPDLPGGKITFDAGLAAGDVLLLVRDPASPGATLYRNNVPVPLEDEAPIDVP